MSENIVADLNKGINAGYSFGLSENITPDFREVSKPSLLTALLQPKFNNHAVHSFIYDKQTKTVGLPNVKARTENGKQQQAYAASQLVFSTGSFGTVANVQKQDWFGIRKVGGAVNESKTEADAIVERLEQMSVAWDLHTELGLAQLITADTNLLGLGGDSNIFASYDYSLVINGASRVDETVDFAGASDDVENRFTMTGKRKVLQQELSRLGMSASGFVCICGDNFFRARYTSEAQLAVARDLRSAVDLGTGPISQMALGGFIYDNFVSSDGIWYINYGSEIISGTQLIDDNRGYLMPRTAGLLSVEYSPTMRRSHDGGLANASDMALPMYVFSKVSDYGVTMLTESNRLYFNRYPQLIKELKLP